MDLAALADFHAVAAADGFGRASRATGRPKATLSRRVRDLEESLGLRLIERGSRSLRLTDEGRALFERTRGLLREIEEVGQQLAGGGARPQGLLRISAPALFSNTLGAEVAARFCQRYPEVRLEWIGEDRQVDLVEDSYDVAIRVNPHPETDLVGRCFARDEMLLVAAPTLPLPQAQEGEPEPRVPAVAMAGLNDTTPWRIAVDGRDIALVPDYRLRLSSLLMVRDAVLASAGVAQLPRSIIRKPLEMGQLVAWGALPNRTVELWALHSSRRLVSPKVAAFMAHLVAEFPDQVL